MAQKLTESGRQGLQDITIKALKLKIKNRFELGRYNRPILILGPTGVGKTTCLMQLAKELGVGYKEIRLGNFQETDLIGLPVKQEITDNEGAKRMVVKWVAQGFLPDTTLGDCPERGLLVFDEITNCSREVQRAVWQLLDASRSVGDYHLPEKWLIVCAGNGPEDGGDYQCSTGALFGRCECKRIAVDIPAWREWAFRAHVHPAVTAYIQFSPDSLWDFDANDTTYEYGKIFPQPRTWALASDNIIDEETVLHRQLTIDEVIDATSGYIGDEANKFAAFYTMQDSLANLDNIENGDFSGIERSMSSREKMYLMTDAITSRLNDNLVAFKKDATAKDKIYNILNWVFKAADSVKGSLDFAMNVIQDIMTTNSAGFMQFLIANSSEIYARIPSFKQFKDNHSDMLAYDSKN